MTNVRGLMTGLPLLLLMVGAGAGCEEPTAAPPESPAVARVQEAAQQLQLMEENELDRVVTIREEVLASLGLRLHRNTDNSPPDPGQYLGATLVRNASTHEYELDESATGAPSDGVRVVLYRHTTAGGFQIPLAEEGFIDFTYDEFGGSVDLLIRMEVDGVERLEVEDASTYAGPSGEQFMPSFNGTLGEDEQHLEVSIHENIDEATDDIAVQLRLGDATYVEFGLVEDVASGEVQGGLNMNWQSSGFGDVLQLQATFGGNTSSVTLQGEASVDVTTDDGQHSYTHAFDLSGTLVSPHFEFTCCQTPPAGLTAEMASLVGTVVGSAEWLAYTFGLDGVIP